MTITYEHGYDGSHCEVWNTRAAKRVVAPPQGRGSDHKFISYVLFTSDEAHCVIGNGSSVECWDVYLVDLATRRIKELEDGYALADGVPLPGTETFVKIGRDQYGDVVCYHQEPGRPCVRRGKSPVKADFDHASWALSPSAKYAVAWRFRTVYGPAFAVWEAATCRCVASLDVRWQKENRDKCKGAQPCCFSPDDGYFAISDRGKRRPGVWIWDLRSGRKTATAKVTKGAITSLKFLPNSKGLLVGTDEGELVLVDVPGGRVVQRFKGQAGAVQLGSIDSAAQYAVSYGPAERNRYAPPPGRLWEIKTGRLLKGFQGWCFFDEKGGCACILQPERVVILE